MLEAIQTMMEPLKAKVGLMVGRCVLRAVSDANKLQRAQVQVLAEETHDDVERVQQYGFTSVPFSGAEGVVVFVGGNRDHGLVIAVDDRRYRLVGLAPGEVALYDDQGQKVHLTRSGIVIDGGGHDLVIQNAPNVRMTGSLFVAGSIQADGDIADQGGAKTMNGMRQAYNSHTNGSGTTTPTPAM
ncbi:Bacteriophage Mu Gp45 protein [Cupriavidus necator]|uniref:Bacteriophage Mu Gp45 protein n=1 Tax=Cupriavidus necator TaxID=106590 RepID=A0A1K0JE40_CUPNE|nr:Bacteriophage Mu Gp45 protein [Cupriavidus necator]